MKSGAFILYGSPKKLTNAHKPVHHRATFSKGEYYVRMDFISGMDCLEALNHAKPIDGETVLNTVDTSL